MNDAAATPLPADRPGPVFPIGSAVGGAVRLVVYGLWVLACMPVQALAVRFGWALRRRFPRLFHRVCARLIGLSLVTRGAICDRRPTLFVSNHLSYLDIAVLGALIDGSFIAKAEVARWPLFGTLARLQETIFVEREARGQVARQRSALLDRLAAGDNLILFPEGTSSDGTHILPFKSALFAAAAAPVGGDGVQVQPVSIAATALDGIPLGRSLRPLYAWYGDMDLAPHLWTLLKLGRLTVEVEFHPPVTLASLGSRKALADHCWQAIARGVSRSLAGAARSGDDPIAADDPVPALFGDPLEVEVAVT